MPLEQQDTKGAGAERCTQAYGVVAQKAHDCSKGRGNTKGISVGALSKGKES